MVDKSILEVASWRQRKGITLESIADSTKLSIRHLSAIEAGDFKSLPGGIYNTSYIRQYARAIGFDEARLLECYASWANPAPLEEASTRRNTPRISGPLFQH